MIARHKSKILGGAAIAWVVGGVFLGAQGQGFPATDPRMAPPAATPAPGAPSGTAAYPPGWYYNPYTQGSAPCPQGYFGGPQCAKLIPPSTPAR